MNLVERELGIPVVVKKLKGTRGAGVVLCHDRAQFDDLANLLDGAHRRLSERISAYALYIDPPLGRVGMTETQARATGRPLLIAKRPMSRVGRAVEKGETLGFMKVVADAETKKILGAAILGTGGDEAIHGVLDIMNANVTYDVLQRAMPIHPTVSELIPTLLGDMHAWPHPRES